MHYTPDQIAKAKAYPLKELLSKYGYHPAKQYGNKLSYLSPFRQERTPSFVVFTDSNKYKDFGSDAKGNPVELVMSLERCTFTEAVAKLLENEPTFSCTSNTSSISPEAKSYSIESVKPLQNTYLLQKVRERAIKPEIAKAYLREIYYKVRPDQEKNFFGVGMQNQSNGYEIKSFLNDNYYCLGAKDISYFNGGYTQTAIFEGMFDFLAFLTYIDSQRKELKANALILHSISLKHKVAELIPLQQKVFLCLDNDKAGIETTKFLQSQYPNNSTLNHLYKDYKDFNEFWLYGNSKQ